MIDFRRWFVAAAALTLFIGPACAQGPYLISTFAGGLTAPTAAAATGYAIRSPNGIATDRFGNTYISTTSNIVFRLDPSGNLSRVAGTGEAGFSGDGGPAVNAQLNEPMGLALDLSGNLYISDQHNQRIRQVNPSGVITTFAGNGSPGYSGDHGPAATAQLNSPAGLAVDPAGNVYIADEYNNVVRGVAPGGTITTVAGTHQTGTTGDGGPATSATLTYPVALATDSSGNLYIGDGSYQVRKVSTNGVITHIAGDGTLGDSVGPTWAATSQIGTPAGLAFDAAGNLYIADEFSQTVRVINPQGVMNTFAGGGASLGDGGSALNARISFPNGVAADYRNNIYILDKSNRVRVVNTAGIINTAIGTGSIPFSGDGGIAAFAQFSGTWGLALDGANNLYVVDSENYRVRKIPLSGGTAGIVSTFAGAGSTQDSGNGGQATSAGITPNVVAIYGSNVYIADVAQVRSIASDGTISTVAGTGVSGYSGDNGPATSAMLSSYLTGLAVDLAGNLYIADTDYNVIRKVTPGGTITTVAGTGALGFGGDNGPGTSAVLNYPTGLTVDPSGTNLYIADNRNCRVRKLVLGTNGNISTVAGNGTCMDTGDGLAATAASISNPWGLAVDGAGNLYIATQNNEVRTVSAQGVIGTIAGTGVAGYSGDGGPATSAMLNYPVAVQLDSSGNLFVSDFGNNAIRVLQPVGSEPVLKITVTHNGAFTAGAQASVTIAVSNAEQAGSTNGTVTLTDILPASLTHVSMQGTGWTCTYTAPAYSCTNSTVVGPGQSYGDLTLVVNVASNGPVQVSQEVAVSGGGFPGAGIQDVAFIGAPAPELNISVSHSGSFMQGEDGNITINVGNALSAPSTTGTVTLSDTLPSGLSLISMQGTGWNCTGTTCTNTGILGGGASFNPIFGTVGVASNISSPVTNAATASGGGSAQASASDSIAIPPLRCAVSGDASASIVDVQVVVNEALGLLQAADDLNRDGFLNVADIQITINSVLNSTCVL